jgi:hypothetical protein
MVGGFDLGGMTACYTPKAKFRGNEFISSGVPGKLRSDG